MEGSDFLDMDAASNTSQHSEFQPHEFTVRRRAQPRDEMEQAMDGDGMRPSRFNLYDLNNKLNDEEKRNLDKNGYFISVMKRLVEKNIENDNDFAGRWNYEKLIIEQMNDFLCFDMLSRQIIFLVMLPNGFSFKCIKPEQLKLMLPFTVEVVSPQLIKERRLYLDQIDSPSALVTQRLWKSRDKNGQLNEPQLALVSRSLADIWLNSELRNQCERIEFEPRPASLVPRQNTAFNTWCGFDTTFSRDRVIGFKDWSLIEPILTHIKLGWCDNDVEFMYLLGMLAELIQRPWVKPGVAIGVHGDQGTGKTMIFDALVEAIGKMHAVKVQTSEDFVGKYTSVLSSKVLVYFDEAFIPDDKAALGYLKNYITSTDERVRMMYADAYYERGAATIIMTSNYPDFMPVDLENEDRRNFPLLSSLDMLTNEHTKDLFGFVNGPKEYFSFLFTALYGNDNIGLKTLMNFLYNIDLNHFWDGEAFDHRRVPSTSSIRRMYFRHEMKKDPVKTWWYSCIERGFAINGRWENVLPKDDLYNSFLADSGKTFSSKIMSKKQFIKQLMDLSGMKEYAFSGREQEETEWHGPSPPRTELPPSRRPVPTSLCIGTNEQAKQDFLSKNKKGGKEIDDFMDPKECRKKYLDNVDVADWLPKTIKYGENGGTLIDALNYGTFVCKDEASFEASDPEHTTLTTDRFNALKRKRDDFLQSQSQTQF